MLSTPFGKSLPPEARLRRPRDPAARSPSLLVQACRSSWSPAVTDDLLRHFGIRTAQGPWRACRSSPRRTRTTRRWRRRTTPTRGPRIRACASPHQRRQLTSSRRRRTRRLPRRDPPEQARRAPHHPHADLPRLAHMVTRTTPTTRARGLRTGTRSCTAAAARGPATMVIVRAEQEQRCSIEAQDVTATSHRRSRSSRAPGHQVELTSNEGRPRPRIPTARCTRISAEA